MTARSESTASTCSPLSGEGEETPSQDDLANRLVELNVREGGGCILLTCSVATVAVLWWLVFGECREEARQMKAEPEELLLTFALSMFPLPFLC